MTDGSLRMKTAEEDGGPERVRCQKLPEIVRFPVKIPLLNLSNGFHRSFMVSASEREKLMASSR